MSKTIEGVPQSITREQYRALIEAAGFDPGELLELRFARDGIYATIRARDAEGKMRIDGEELAAHEVYVDVRDEVYGPGYTFADMPNGLLPGRGA